MKANRSAVARLEAALVLVTASTAGLANSAAAVPTHEPTDGADGGAVFLDPNVP
jgi:hypothetical protein